MQKKTIILFLFTETEEDLKEEVYNSVKEEIHGTVSTHQPEHQSKGDH